MNTKIESLILETVGEVLLEGRLEDVKAKYPDNDNLIDTLSQSDPSGNNKYLEWMAKLALGHGEDKDIPTADVITDLVQRFHKNMARINNNMSKEIVEINPNLFPGRSARRVSNNPKDINSYTTYLGLKKVVEEAEENAPNKDDRDKIYQDSNWTVIVPKTHESSCKYGRHSNWCVSTSNDYYFRSYTERGMLFFILWRKQTEGMSKEGEYKVAAFVNFDSPSYDKWEWYNKKDTRMDNDLPLAIFPPALIQSIKDKLRTALKEKGYLMDISEEELNEKTHLLKVTKNDGLNNEEYIFIPKQNQDNTWLNKYMKKSYYHVVGNGYENNKIPVIKLVGPNVKVGKEHIDVDWVVRRVVNSKTWRNSSTPYELFLNTLPYQSLLSEEKKQEVFEYVKDYVKNSYDGYVSMPSNDLEIGDYVRWERKTRTDRNRLGRYRQGEIIRQTPSGFFVVDIEGEDKPSRFKPDYGKYMDKRFKGSELPDDFWEPNNEEQ